MRGIPLIFLNLLAAQDMKSKLFQSIEKCGKINWEERLLKILDTLLIKNGYTLPSFEGFDQGHKYFLPSQVKQFPLEYHKFTGVELFLRKLNLRKLGLALL